MSIENDGRKELTEEEKQRMEKAAEASIIGPPMIGFIPA